MKIRTSIVIAPCPSPPGVCVGGGGGGGGRRVDLTSSIDTCT